MRPSGAWGFPTYPELDGDIEVFPEPRGAWDSFELGGGGGGGGGRSPRAYDVAAAPHDYEERADTASSYTGSDVGSSEESLPTDYAEALEAKAARTLQVSPGGLTDALCVPQQAHSALCVAVQDLMAGLGLHGGRGRQHCLCRCQIP